MLKAFIFDVDGTLADTERHGHRVAFNLAFDEAGLDWHWDEDIYGELLAVTGGKERMRHYVETRNKTEKGSAGLDQLIKQLHAQKTRYYVELLRSNVIPLRAGVERLLNEARNNDIRLAIATTTTAENVEVLLENTLGSESLGWFDVIGAGDIVPEKKPAPDIYLYVLNRLGLDVGDCLAFEDSVNGIRASLGAGLDTIITYNGYTAQEDFTDAKIVLDCIGDVDEPSSVMQSTFQQDYLTIDLIRQMIEKPDVRKQRNQR